jgi:hypothetical protein
MEAIKRDYKRKITCPVCEMKFFRDHIPIFEDMYGIPYTVCPNCDEAINL